MPTSTKAPPLEEVCTTSTLGPNLAQHPRTSYVTYCDPLEGCTTPGEVTWVCTSCNGYLTPRHPLVRGVQECAFWTTLGRGSINIICDLLGPSRGLHHPWVGDFCAYPLPCLPPPSPPLVRGVQENGIWTTLVTMLNGIIYDLLGCSPVLHQVWVGDLGAHPLQCLPPPKSPPPPMLCTTLALQPNFAGGLRTSNVTYCDAAAAVTRCGWVGG